MMKKHLLNILFCLLIPAQAVTAQSCETQSGFTVYEQLADVDEKLRIKLATCIDSLRKKCQTVAIFQGMYPVMEFGYVNFNKHVGLHSFGVMRFDGKQARAVVEILGKRSEEKTGYILDKSEVDKLNPYYVENEDFCFGSSGFVYLMTGDTLQHFVSYSCDFKLDIYPGLIKDFLVRNNKNFTPE